MAGTQQALEGEVNSQLHCSLHAVGSQLLVLALVLVLKEESTACQPDCPPGMFGRQALEVGSPT
jgi:hypothetical protein